MESLLSGSKYKNIKINKKDNFDRVGRMSLLYAYTISFQMVEHCYWSNSWLGFATTE